MFDVSDILKHDAEVFEKDIELNIKEMEYDYNNIVFINPLVLKAKLHSINKILTIEGNVDISFNIHCYLCNEEYQYSQNITINEIFRQSPGDEEYEILSDKIDLEKAITDNIILQLPKQFMCNPNCKGICQVCGKNRNIEQCDCKINNIDPRLEKLKDLL